MRYYIDVMDHELGDDGKRARIDALEEGAVMTAPILKALHEVTAERDALREKVRSSITSYAQIEAIHEAMRELEACLRDVGCGPSGKTKLNVALAGDVYRCLFKISSALSGDWSKVDDHQDVLNERVLGKDGE